MDDCYSDLVTFITLLLPFSPALCSSIFGLRSCAPSSLFPAILPASFSSDDDAWLS